MWALHIGPKKQNGHVLENGCNNLNFNDLWRLSKMELVVSLGGGGAKREMSISLKPAVVVAMFLFLFGIQ
jgi:hypothetical protein